MDFKLLIEKKYPIVASAIATGIFMYIYHEKTGCFTIIVELSKLFISLSGTLLGFLVTIITIINSINTTRMRAIKVTSNYPRLMSYLKNSILSNIMLILISIIFVIQDIHLDSSKFEHANKFTELTSYIFSFSTAYCFLTTYRFISIFLNLMIEKKQD